METLGDKIETYVAAFKCGNCDKQYKNRTGLWRHKKNCCYIQNKSNDLATTDYNSATNGYNLATIGNNLATRDVISHTITPHYDGFTCDICSKKYIHRQGLWRHKKKCVGLQKNNSNYGEKEFDKDNLIMMLIKENADFKKLLMEQQSLMMKVIETGTTNNNNSNNTTTNSHNKAFNLNLFLNETCKNAMNISDFIDSIKLQLSDFINMGEVGFVEGISNIIVKNLNSLDETVRPIHCTDQKRETFYVKDKNIWEKDDDEKKKMKQMIKNISYKNEKLMKVYKETYPDYNNPDSKRSDQYSKIMIEAMDCKDDSKDKIIRNISKATTIKNKI
jgi:hypothetical protein